MLRVQRRIEKLQKAFGLTGRVRLFEHRIVFVDGEGRTDRMQLLIAEGRMEWIECEAAE
jgi:hypothetical protein